MTLDISSPLDMTWCPRGVEQLSLRTVHKHRGHGGRRATISASVEDLHWEPVTAASQGAAKRGFSLRRHLTDASSHLSIKRPALTDSVRRRGRGLNPHRRKLTVSIFPTPLPERWKNKRNMTDHSVFIRTTGINAKKYIF